MKRVFGLSVGYSENKYRANRAFIYIEATDGGPELFRVPSGSSAYMMVPFECGADPNRFEEARLKAHDSGASWYVQKIELDEHDLARLNCYSVAANQLPNPPETLVAVSQYQRTLIE